MANLSDDDKAKTIKQIEFYFSDSNLPKDAFLKKKIAEDPDGYVPLNIILAFKKMREILKLNVSQPDKVPAEAVAGVAEALRAGSQALDVDASGKKIRRKAPIENLQKLSVELDERSLFYKPFPYDTELEQLQDFFQKEAKVKSVRLRRFVHHNKAFRGSVFVEFESTEEAERMLGVTLTYAGAPLKCMRKLEYLKAKEQLKKNRKPAYEEDEFSNDELPDGFGGTATGAVVPGRREALAAAKAQAGSQVPGTAGMSTEPNPKKRDREEDAEQEADKKAAKKADTKDKEGAAESKDADMEDAAGEDEEQEGGDEQEEIKYDEGLLVSFSLEEALPATVRPRDIAQAHGGSDSCRFVELQQDRKGGILRFITAEVAAKALSDFEAKAEDEKKIGGVKATMAAVTGEEEKEFHKRGAQAVKQQKNGEVKYTPGLLLSFTLEEALPQTVGPKVLAEACGGKLVCKFVELNEDRMGGTMRFVDAEHASNILTEFEAKAEGDKVLLGIKATMAAVTGDEEKEYHQRAQSAVDAKRADKAGRGRGGGGRGGRGGGGGRGRGGGRWGGRGGGRGRGRR